MSCVCAYAGTGSFYICATQNLLWVFTNVFQLSDSSHIKQPVHDEQPNEVILEIWRPVPLTKDLVPFTEQSTLNLPTENESMTSRFFGLTLICGQHKVQFQKRIVLGVTNHNRDLLRWVSHVVLIT